MTYNIVARPKNCTQPRAGVVRPGRVVRPNGLLDVQMKERNRLMAEVISFNDNYAESERCSPRAAVHAASMPSSFPRGRPPSL